MAAKKPAAKKATPLVQYGPPLPSSRTHTPSYKMVWGDFRAYTAAQQKLSDALKSGNKKAIQKAQLNVVDSTKGNRYQGYNGEIQYEHDNRGRKYTSPQGPVKKQSLLNAALSKIKRVTTAQSKKIPDQLQSRKAPDNPALKGAWYNTVGKDFEKKRKQFRKTTASIRKTSRRA